MPTCLARLFRDAVKRCEGREVDNRGTASSMPLPAPNQHSPPRSSPSASSPSTSGPTARRYACAWASAPSEPAVGEERYVGLGVHRAARIGAVGHGGQVLISGATRELTEDEVGGVTVRPLGTYRLKDFDRPEPLCPLDIEGLQPGSPARRRASSRAALASAPGAASRVGRRSRRRNHRRRDPRPRQRRISAQAAARQRHPNRPEDAEGDAGCTGGDRPGSHHRVRRLPLGHEQRSSRHGFERHQKRR